jgi:hydroxyethylthiazole kinase-like uncharacterized protein yjeF
MVSPGKILAVEQIREADQYTILHEPIASVDLMERAGSACTDWIRAHKTQDTQFLIFCGTGNNGGDGLVIARQLSLAGYEVKVLIVPTGKISTDHSINRSRLQDTVNLTITDMQHQLPFIPADVCIIDALLGTGVNRPLNGLIADCVHAINASGAEVISVDMPSGLFADSPMPDNSTAVQASYTLSFECPRLCFFFPENEKYVGEWHVLPINLHPEFMKDVKTDDFFLTKAYIRSLLHQRKKFSHKGIYGHALLVAGTTGKMGAAVLATGAALRSGAGLVTVNIPASGAVVLTGTHPEAMLSLDAHNGHLTAPADAAAYSAAGAGPGLGMHAETQSALLKWISAAKQAIVLDADALNIISLHKNILSSLPHGSILTPHPKEWIRMNGEDANSFGRIQAIRKFAAAHKVVIVLKGAHTCIAAPSGEIFFNTTGNPGMAKGGTGDVLTGLITGLLAQQYTPLEAACIGVYVHGLAGDLARSALGETGMTAGDIMRLIPQAFQYLYTDQ